MSELRPLTIADLYQIIGQKDAAIIQLQRYIDELRAEINSLEPSKETK